jgi:stage II sporulation protein D
VRFAAIILAVAVALFGLPASRGAASSDLTTVAGPSPALSVDPSPAPSPTPTGQGPLPGPFTFYGRGYGHGVGMAQYGARGRALAGQSATTILGHYYPGTTLGSVSPSTSVRALVLSSFAPTSSAFRIYGRGGSWKIEGIATVFPRDAMLTLSRVISSAGTVSWRLRVFGADGRRLLNRTAPPDLRVRPAVSATRLQLWSKPSSYDLYRGNLRILAKSTINVVNEVPLDLYLRGVVPTEMPYTWPREALRAQSIAARSFAARKLRPGVGTWDVTDDSSSQVYRGVRAEKSQTTQAIVDTRGVVVRSGTAIASTMFHSANGGATENNEFVYVNSSGAVVAGPVSYLRGVPDRAPNGVAYDAASPYATWRTATLSGEQLSAMFGADPRTHVGPITGLDLSRRGVSGRLIAVTLSGALGTRTVSGELFRSVFNARRPAGTAQLRSTLFDLAPIP